MSFIDKTGALYIITKIKTLLDGKVSIETGKGLSTNDYTTEEKTKLSGIATGANKYTHPSNTARTSGLYKVTVDALGHVTDVSAVTKADITALGIPGENTNTTYSMATSSAGGLMSPADKAKLDAFGAASTYALKSDIANMYRYKGSVDSESELPETGQTVGDVYNIVAASSYGPAGQNVAWNGTAWDNLGGLYQIDAVTPEEIDAMFSYDGGTLNINT